ncbi:patatin-like phospholipase family protein [Gynuella sp.]|uniref:patatin-like phospholipase family protein n=1 Tax=Gynuella sp. TaxID=2969146 RepID=UPI003D0E9415
MENSAKKVAFVISGAAAFIPQELACIRAIMEAKYPGATEKITPAILAGTSSGSICTILVNGVINGKITWDQVENDIIPAIKNNNIYDNELFQQALLFNAIQTIIAGSKSSKDTIQLYNDVVDLLKNHSSMKWQQVLKKLISIFGESIKEYKEIRAFASDVATFIQKVKHYDYETVKAAYQAIFENIGKGYVLDTAPLKVTLEKYINTVMDFKTMEQLPCHTLISAVSVADGSEKRFDSTENDDKDTNLVDIILASTAIPVIFPERAVNTQMYVDGGTGTDNFPVPDIMVAGEKFDEVYVITHKNETLLGKPIAHNYTWMPILSNLSFALAVQGGNTVTYQMAQSLSIVDNPQNAYLYMPDFDQNFGMLDFDSMPEQLKESKKYCEAHSPEKVVDVLKRINFPVSS